jgi:hypothetical protein
VLPYVKPPAVVRPVRQIGNDICGVIEMEVRGGLTVRESDMITDIQDSEESSFVAAAKLSEALAAAENITVSEAFRLIDDTLANRPMEPEARTIQLRNAARIDEIRKVYRRLNRQSSHATVTALIRTRCNRPDWTVEQTAALDGPIFDGIWELALDEQKTEDMPSAPPTEDDIKKQPQDSTTPPKRTGAKSSGN